LRSKSTSMWLTRQLLLIPFRCLDFFSSLQQPDRLWGPPNLLSNWHRGLLPQGVKRPGREADRTPPPSAEVKNAWIYTSTPPTSSWRGA
jgi:hypothetical protein